MMINDKTQSAAVAIVCPFTVLEPNVWTQLVSVFGNVALIETPFSKATEVFADGNFFSVFSSEELVQIRRQVENMKEMGEEDSASLKRLRTQRENNPYLMPKILELSNEIYKRLHGGTAKKNVSIQAGILLALLDTWDRTQIDLLKRFQEIGEAEKKMFQEVLAFETSTEITPSILNRIDLGSMCPFWRMEAWINCIRPYKKALPRIWVTPSSVVTAWLEGNGWITMSVVWKGRFFSLDSESSISFWQTIREPVEFKKTDILFEDQTVNFPIIELQLGKLKGQLEEDFGSDFLFCSIKLDG